MDTFLLSDQISPPPVVLRRNPLTGKYQVFARTNPPRSYVNRLLAEQELELGFALDDAFESRELVPLAKNIEGLRKLLSRLPEEPLALQADPITRLRALPRVGTRRTRIQMIDGNNSYLGVNSDVTDAQTEQVPVLKKRNRKEVAKTAKLRRSIVRLFLQHIRGQFQGFKLKKRAPHDEQSGEDRSRRDKMSATFGNENTAEPSESVAEPAKPAPAPENCEGSIKFFRRVYFFLRKHYRVPKKVVINNMHIYTVLLGQHHVDRRLRIQLRSQEMVRVLNDVLEAKRSPKATRNFFKKQPVLALWQNTWNGPTQAFGRSLTLRRFLGNSSQETVLAFFRQLLEECSLPYSSILQ